jgi:hypothetical protein
VRSLVGRRTPAPITGAIERCTKPEVIMEMLILVIALVIILIALDRGDAASRAKR